MESTHHVEPTVGGWWRLVRSCDGEGIALYRTKQEALDAITKGDNKGRHAMNKHTNHETLPDEMGRELHAHLLKQTRWLTTLEFQYVLGFSRRDCKLARVAAGAECVISTNAGYRATELATNEELKDARDMYGAQKDAAYLNELGVHNVIMKRLRNQAATDQREVDRLREVSNRMQRGEVVDVWAAINNKKDAA